MKFKAGDPVWAICDRQDLGLRGELPATVIGLVQVPPEDRIFLALFVDGDLYAVNIPDYPNGARCSFVPAGCWITTDKFLRPRHDDDATPDAAGSWDHCPFKPEKALA